MPDVPYEDTDQRIGGHDADEYRIPSVLDGPDGKGLYPWMNYTPISYVDRYGDKDA